MVYKNSCGQIKNFFTPDQVKEMVEVFAKVSPTVGENNDCFGIDRNHKAYSWLNKIVVRPIANQFDPELKVIFAMLLNCVQPFDIHSDLKDIPDKNGKHYLSFLIPYSVDNRPELCDQASTLIFNEREFAKSTVENNVNSMYKEKISHVTEDFTYRLTLKQDLIWSVGSLCWWDSSLLHVSNNFIQKGYTSKQAIVMHTYVL